METVSIQQIYCILEVCRICIFTFTMEEDFDGLFDAISEHISSLIQDGKHQPPVTQRCFYESTNFTPSKTNIKDLYILAQCDFGVEYTQNILSIVYLDRLLSTKDFQFCASCWRYVVSMCIYLAVKYLDDLKVPVSSTASIFNISPILMNTMEIELIKLLDFNLYVSAFDYEKYILKFETELCKDNCSVDTMIYYDCFCIEDEAHQTCEELECTFEEQRHIYTAHFSKSPCIHKAMSF